MSEGVARTYLQLFGDVRLIEPERVPFGADKRFQLLAYLAYTGDWVSREQLADLFWQETSTEKAQQNLRQLLHRVRAFAWLTGLETSAHRVRWSVRTDVAAFRQALGQANPDEALFLYRGPLLDNLGGAELAFSTWLEIERGRLHSLWREALIRRAEALQGAGRPAETTGLLSLLLERDGLDEEALRAFMRAAAQAEQPARALEAYDRFSARLKHDLSLEPTSATQGLADAIRHAGQLPSQSSSVPSGPGASALAFATDAIRTADTPVLAALPTPVSSFVGRDVELAKVARLLANPDCRLLTLTGAGGVGKTRLAMQAARELARHYKDGACFIPLDALMDPGLIPAVVSGALDIQLQGQDDPLQQVTRYLGTKKLLLILDNFEHLLDGAAFVAGLVQACPNLTLLVTSRERLNLLEEWLLLVEGLPFPIKTHISTKEALASEAVSLFIQRASQVRVPFAPTEEDLLYITEICQLVQGSPLAIELAAVWVRMMSCKEIAEEIQTNLNILDRSSSHLPQRHKSLQATFEYSWRLLAPVEHEVLRKLSLFKGGFGKEAAAVVAGASIAVLASLIDKSLLRAAGRDRYDQHPLLSQFTQEKLANHPGERAQTLAKHAGYYFRSLQERNLEMKGRAQREGLLAMAEELENIRAAWQWAVAELKVEALREAIEPLTLFYDRQARYKEGIDLLGKALASLSEADTHHQLALGNALVGQAFLHHWSSNYEEAVRLARRGLELLRPLEESWGIMVGLDALGFVAAFTGNFAEGKRCWTEALALAKAQQNAAKTAELLSIVGMTEAWQGNQVEAEVYLDEAMVLTPPLGKHTAVIYILLNLGFVNVLDDPRKAQLAFRQALELTHELGYRRHLPYLLYGLGWSLCELEQNLEAQAFCKQAIEVAKESGNLFAESMALAILGKATGELHDYTQAQDYLQQSLRLDQLTQSMFAMPVTLAYLAALWIGQGRAEEAAEVLGLILHQLTAISFAQVIAERLLTELKDKLPEETLMEAIARGTSLRLEEVVEEILRQDSSRSGGLCS